MKTIFLIILWVVLGINILIYDWTRRHDLTVKDAVVVGFCGAGLGPFAIIPLVINSPNGTYVLIKRAH